MLTNTNPINKELGSKKKKKISQEKEGEKKFITFPDCNSIRLLLYPFPPSLLDSYLRIAKAIVLSKLNKFVTVL